MTSQNKEKNNFLEVGRMIECGACRPEKFEDCKDIEKKYHVKCNCICHDKKIDSSRFFRVYANIPMGIRRDIIAIIDGEPCTWGVCYIEIKNKTKMAEKMLVYLDKMKFI